MGDFRVQKRLLVSRFTTLEEAEAKLKEITHKIPSETFPELIEPEPKDKYRDKALSERVFINVIWRGWDK